jgi:sugar-specific transcriptional regulator TrmB
MKQEKEKILEELGLSKNETKVYLALLELGLSSLKDITSKSGVHRTNVYDSLKRLVKKGLVSHVTKDNKTAYEA